MSSYFNPENIKVKKVNVFYDNSTHTKTKETTNLLQYESNHFRCKSTLEFEQSNANSNWSIGLVQACDRMYLENRYGNVGSSYWEFHPLKSQRHRMVNDSDGRQYPFYSLTSSKCEVRKGNVQDCIVKLEYEDHFYPTVAWELPFCGGAKLTDVIRKQDFWVWLVAIKRGSSHELSYDYFNAHSDELHVLNTMRWRYNLHMTFDPHMPVGRRLKNIADTQEELPYMLETEKKPPISAMCPPHCNSAQSLIWYPRSHSEKARILVPPKQIIVPWDTWMTDMITNRHLNVNKPKDCRLVGEWTSDHDVGILRSRRFSQSLRRTSNGSYVHRSR